MLSVSVEAVVASVCCLALSGSAAVLGTDNKIVNFNNDYQFVPNFGRQSSGMEPGRPGGGGEWWVRGSPHPTAAAAVAAACHVEE
ncbi:hypothetical protein Pmani_011048 [Petrolisthes manimaculis]|uniref:Uncharacterized protein n=1 Tax=Petrolisthes manimaculis TaxID=1843537 RepID=A0AAE1Q0G9_9EUCA|nr:hypothetical protein Pmani_011048 [Petrolisthes manimaculis]